MKLYHGTAGEVARAALTRGLSPRAISGHEGNWPDQASCPDLVYLTTVYAPYFAASAEGVDEERMEAGDIENALANRRWGLVEVETDRLDEWCLRPDEDFMEQATRRSQAICPYRSIPRDEEQIKRRTDWYRDRLEYCRSYWRQSVEGLGNCAYHGVIPARAVTRVAIYDPTTNPTVTLTAIDPSITTTNYALCGGKYRALTRWFFGEEIEPHELMTALAFVVDPAMGMEFRAKLDEAYAALRKALADRSGLEVIENTTLHDRISIKPKERRGEHEH